MVIIHVDSQSVQFHGKLRERIETSKREVTAVPTVPNGVRASSLAVHWTKSRYSNAEGNCVEVASLADGAVAIRNSRDPHGPALVYTPAEIEAFLAGVKDGEFDHFV